MGMKGERIETNALTVAVLPLTENAVASYDEGVQAPSLCAKGSGSESASRFSREALFFCVIQRCEYNRPRNRYQLFCVANLTHRNRLSFAFPKLGHYRRLSRVCLSVRSCEAIGHPYDKYLIAALMIRVNLLRLRRRKRRKKWTPNQRRNSDAYANGQTKRFAQAANRRGPGINT